MSSGKIFSLLLLVAVALTLPLALPAIVDARGADISQIQSGDTIFVYEQGLDVSQLGCVPTQNVSSITVNTIGSGYSSPTVLISGGGGSGALATVTANPLVTGVITGITVNNGGSGYTTATVNISGDGTGATATATIASGIITGITVNTGGSGYTIATVNIVGANTTSATATATIGTTGGEINASSITITNGGSGYTSAPSVAISGGAGSGASATAHLGITTNCKTVTELVMYEDDDITKSVVGVPIPISTQTDFDVIPESVVTYGKYYASHNFVPISTANFVWIRQTDLTLGVVLNTSHIDSVNGKSVTRSTPIDFKVSSPFVGSYYHNNVGGQRATIYIEVTTPGGGHLTSFGGLTMSSETVPNQLFYIGGCDLSRVEAGQYTAVAKWGSPSGFRDSAPISNQVSFTVASKPLTITTSKETVVRGNSFVISVTGESKAVYNVFVKDVTGNAPTIPDGQVDVTNRTSANTAASLQMDASGMGSVQYDTTSSTDDVSFTIEVQDPSDTSKYDTVEITVIKGTLTATATGTGTYYFGETITLSGTNSESDDTYLFLIGPNLDTNGVKLSDISKSVDDGVRTSFQDISVDADNKWSYKWDTGDLGGNTLDAGSYTVYAVAEPRGSHNLSDAAYSTVSIQFNKAYVSIVLSSNTAAGGDEFDITGVASGHPTAVYVWIFGKNYRSMYNAVTVQDDNTYKYKLDGSQTQDLYYGQYFVVVQHPMANGPGIIGADSNENSCSGTSCYGITGNVSGNTYKSGLIKLTGLQASDAATALTDALNSPNIDDTYAKASFTIEAPFIRLASISDQKIGNNVTVTGTTNLAVGDRVQMDVTSASFNPTQKTQTGEFSGASGIAIVEEGNVYNTISFNFDTSTFKEDEYIVTADATQTGTTATTSFNLFTTPPVISTPTTIPTTVPTEQIPATVITTIPPPPTTTPAPGIPGFGAGIAIVGIAIAAVAFLVLRRKD